MVKREAESTACVLSFRLDRDSGIAGGRKSWRFYIQLKVINNGETIPHHSFRTDICNWKDFF